MRSNQLWVVLILVLWSVTGLGRGRAENFNVPHHVLDMRIDPARHELVVRDQIRWSHDRLRSNGWEFQLHPQFVVKEVRIGTEAVAFERMRPDNPDTGAARWKIQPAGVGESGVSDLLIVYRGVVHDPPRPSQGLRFVRPDKTNGHIGAEGVYLTSETLWYPILFEGLKTFQVHVTVPRGWEVVTQGREVAQTASGEEVTADWEVREPTEALTLVANRFVKSRQKWQDIEIASYFFPQEAQLAPEYLEAVARYLNFYTTLLGPYPFAKFAVVENFFPSGIGLPSYTLLGSGVVKRGYTQPYSLGHEIVHSWFGNSVLNDFSQGNWVEGLTTYLANYYFEEVHGSPAQAESLRRHMIFEYSLYASPPDEYPLVRFHHKENRLDNAVGYQKSAMVFHMLRREVGDRAFFEGLRRLVAQRSGVYTDWRDIELIFEEVTGKDLTWFFHQWVERKGAPEFQIVDARLVPGSHSSDSSVIRFNVSQTGDPYRLSLSAFFEFGNGQELNVPLILKDREQTFDIPIADRPITMSLDPHGHVLRRLDRTQIPPLLNGWVTAKHRVIVVPETFSSDEERVAFQPVRDRVQAQGDGTYERGKLLNSPTQESILLLSGPQNDELIDQALQGCGKSVHVEPNGLVINGKAFTGASIAFLVSCPHPEHPGEVISIFSGFSPGAIQRVARLLFFYGWDSYLVFQEGVVVDRGMFEAPQNFEKIRLSGA